MIDPENGDEMEYMKTMFTDDLKFMHRMIKKAKHKEIEKFIKDLRKFVWTTPPNQAEEHFTCDRDIYELINKYMGEL